MVPDIPGAEHGITSDGFFELEERPQRVLVVGSGYIAVELAGVLNGLGSDVQLVVRKDRILRGFDIMLSELLMEAVCKDGIALDVGVVPAAVEKTGDGLVLHAEDGRSFGPFDTVLWAIGRAPNSEWLDLDKAGVERDGDGFLGMVLVEVWREMPAEQRLRYRVLDERQVGDSHVLHRAGRCADIPRVRGLHHHKVDIRLHRLSISKRCTADPRSHGMRTTGRSIPQNPRSG